ncbi:helix-hairpin-helix domain-containing protein [Streptomyces sp. 2RAF24]|uniref:helix-hairpin-helix domain-containing protein n=1 Tax=Streptomyces sp. 2RAF24 TaxID=3232997 RepID=UPI003F9D144B
MTLRTHIATTRRRTRGAVLTSGPGRAPGSDGRARRRTRARHAAGVAPGGVRHRGDALFPAAAPPAAPAPPLPPPPPPAPPPPEPVPRPPSLVPSRKERLWLAVRERLPLWVQSRCGLERRSLAALAVVLVVAAGVAGAFFWTGRPQQVRAPEVVGAARPLPESGPSPGEPGGASFPASSPGSPPGSSPASAAPVVVVDVGGKVRRPGVLTLPAGSRVADALRAAGGVRPGADLTGLNRARVLTDGEQVLVGLPAAGAGVGAGRSGASGPAQPLSLNAATVEQLDTLPGVGPVLARHIVEHRVEHGGFRSVDELREVNGIGERRFADLEPLVRP